MLGFATTVKANPHFYPVILAGGRGTRFWPLSRKRRAKQLLALDGKQTMIQQTVARLAPDGRAKPFLDHHQRRPAPRHPASASEAPRSRSSPSPPDATPHPPLAWRHFFCFVTIPMRCSVCFPPTTSSPSPPNTARLSPKESRSPPREKASLCSASARLAPKPATDISRLARPDAPDHHGFLRVRRFTEKPDLATARQFLDAGNYFWNSGMFLWRADTLANALREHLPNTAPFLEKIAAAYGTRKFADTFRKLYPKCENISIDYAVLEPRSAKGESQSRIFCLPSDFGWNDLGSWTALHEHHVAKAKAPEGSLISAAGSFALNAKNNYVHVLGKFVALVGVSNW
jgi:mannose-1-phosphate guanylyltransferase